MPALVVPNGFEYVIAALGTTPWVLVVQTLAVGRARKASGIKYPQLYAEVSQVKESPAAYKFNCAQRAHANTLESLPVLLTTSLMVGLKYPMLAAGATAVWSVSRLLYTYGYVAHGAERRNHFGGLVGNISQMALLLASVFTGFKFVTEGL